MKRIVIIFGMLFLIIGCSDNATGPENTFEDFLEMGWSSYQEKNWQEAQVNFQKAYDKKPKNPEANLGLGLIYLHSSSYDVAKAENKLLEALNLNSDSFSDNLKIFINNKLNCMGIF